MADFTIVTRDLELDLSPAEAWELIGDADGWTDWMVDEADVEVASGSGGTVTEGGEARRVAVTSVQHGESVRFNWWPADRDELASSVSLTIGENDEGLAVIHVVEVFPPEAPVDPVTAAIAWDVRAVSAWSVSAARCSARV